jgi:hypothetical protein
VPSVEPVGTSISDCLSEKRAEDMEQVVNVRPANRGRGRPKREGMAPWDVLGISESAYYKRKKKGKL